MAHYLDSLHIILFSISFIFGWCIGWLLAKKKQLQRTPNLTPEERELYNYLRSCGKDLQEEFKRIEEVIKRGSV